jgi:hypothetical protein
VTTTIRAATTTTATDRFGGAVALGLLRRGHA